MMKTMGHKPVCLVNIDGFYDGFITQIQRAHAENFLYGPVEDYLHWENDVGSALDYCLANIDTSKVIDRSGTGCVVVQSSSIDSSFGSGSAKVRTTLRGYPDSHTGTDKEKELKKECPVRFPSSRDLLLVSVGAVAGVLCAALLMRHHKS